MKREREKRKTEKRKREIGRAGALEIFDSHSEGYEYLS